MPNVLGCYGPMPFYCSEGAIFNYKDLKTCLLYTSDAADD